ncbi:hypothetical protein [Lentibacillus juripiscarius]|uniref:Uncharacterized protein n=1 Tax=Lentibacillus juripiscarius TaxID=257446 RepID=A0ABW5V3N5_9BACI
MRNWIFHSLNIMVFIIVEAICLFAFLSVNSLFIRFIIIATVVWWGIFYFIQFRKETYAWRLIWFLISVTVLWFWIDYWNFASLGGWKI